MQRMILKRAHGNQDGTYGVLIHNYKPFAVTYELPWRDNKPNISCIPPGQYQAKRKTSQKFGEVFEIQDVEGRTYIYLHAGNFESDTKGCILVGEYFEGEGIAMSGKGFGEFMKILKNEDEFTIEIKE